MFSSEIKETIYIAISAILLASLLGFVSYLLMIRNDFAETRSAQIREAEEMANYREFNTYNDQVLFGEDIVAAVRDYYKSDVRLAVKDMNGNMIYYMDKYKAKTTTGKNQVKISYLQSKFPTTKKYEAVLVYGGVDLNTVTRSYKASTIDRNVSGIVFFHTGSR